MNEPAETRPDAPAATPGETGMLVLDDAALRRWLITAREALGRHRSRLDALNVYPVPDGDTGTNMYLTLDAGVQGFVEALVSHGRSGDGPLGIVAGIGALARSCLFAARGNSGVILGQLLGGMAAAAASAPEVDEQGMDGRLFALALAEADTWARRAVAEPVEGTILTVARSAAAAARVRVEAPDAENGGIAEVVDAACEAARAELRQTPTHLEALARAGVVDAGGAGFVVLLDALAAVVHGDRRSGSEEDGDLAALMSGGTEEWTRPVSAGVSPPAPGASHDPAYEVMFLLDGLGDDDAAALRSRLRDVGDSVLVAGDARLRTVHVHTDEPGAAVEAGMDLGRPYGVRISVLSGTGASDVAPSRGPAASRGPGACGAPGSPAAAQPIAADLGPVVPGVIGTIGAPDAPALGVVACVQAPRLVTLFEEAGAVVVRDAPGRRVTPAQLVGAARATGAPCVVVLPDDGDSILAATAAGDVAAEDGIDLAVVPTRYLLQGLAALAVADPHDAGSIEQMRLAAEHVRCGLVATATSSATTQAGPCVPGDVLGFAGDVVTHVGREADEVAVEVVRSLLTDDSEIVTLVEGENAAGLGRRVAEAAGLDGLEVDVLDGGQIIYDLLIGVE